MLLNKGYPTKNTIVTPKMNHHTLHSLPLQVKMWHKMKIFMPKDIYISPFP